MREPIPSIGLFSHLLNEISYAVQDEPKRTSNFPIQHNTDGMEGYICLAAVVYSFVRVVLVLAEKISYPDKYMFILS